MFQAPKLTNDGKALYYANMAGEPIKFTTIQLGSGSLSGPIANMTALVTPVITIDAELNRYDDYADISGRFSNAGRTDGFYWREIGVFAANPTDPDNRAADVLYCYQNAYDTADFIPAASVETVEKYITVPVIVGDVTAISCTLSKSQITATQKDLEEHNTSDTAHNGTFLTASELEKTLEEISTQLSNKASRTEVQAALSAHDTDEDAHGDIRIRVAGFDSRVRNLETIVGGGISTNPFSITFASLTGVTVAGVWNQVQGRIEF